MKTYGNTVKAALLAAAFSGLFHWTALASWYDAPTVKATIDTGFPGTSDPHFLRLSEDGKYLGVTLNYSWQAPLKLWSVERLIAKDGAAAECDWYAQDAQTFGFSGYAWKGCAISSGRGWIIPCPGNGSAAGRTYALKLFERPWATGTTAFRLEFGIQFDALAFGSARGVLYSNQYDSGARGKIHKWTFADLAQDQTMTGEAHDSGLSRVRNFSLYTVGGRDLIYCGEGDGAAATSGQVKIVDTADWSSVTVTTGLADITNVKVSGLKAGKPVMYVEADDGTIAVYSLNADGKSGATLLKTIDAATVAKCSGLSVSPSGGKFRNLEVTDDGSYAFFMYGTNEDCHNPDNKTMLTVVSSGLTDADTLVYVAGGLQPNQMTGFEMNELKAGDSTKPSMSLDCSVLPVQAVATGLERVYPGSCDGMPALPNATCYRCDGQMTMKMTDLSYVDNSFTVEFFFKTDLDRLAATDGKAYLVAHRGAYWFWMDKDGHVACYASIGEETKTTATYADGLWHHYAVTYDKPNDLMYMYVDRRLVSRGKPTATIPWATPDAMYVGGYWSDEKHPSAAGFYDEIRITKRALRPEELLSPRTLPVSADTAVYMPSGRATVRVGTGTTPLTGYLEENALAGYQHPPLELTYAANPSDEAPDGAISNVYSGAFSGAAYENGLLTHFGNGVASMKMADLSYASGSFTVEFFFKTTASAWSQTDDNVYIAAHRGAWFFQMKKNGCVDVYGSLPGPATRTKGSYADGKWHHYAVSYDRAAHFIKLYIDYRLIASGTPSVAAEGFPWTTPDAAYFGNYWRSESHALGESCMDAIRVTRRALDVDEFLTRRDKPVAAETLIYASCSMSAASDLDMNESVGAANRLLMTYSKAPVLAEPTGLERIYDGARGTVAKNDGCLQFVSGGNVRLDYDDTDYLQDDFTAEVFFKADDATAASGGGDVYLMHQDGAYYIKLRSDGVVTCYASIGGDKPTPKSMCDGQWHHFAVVYRKARSHMQIFVDHQLFAEGVTTAAIPWKTNPTPTLCFGAYHNQDGHFMFMGGGCLDEMRLTRRALLPTEFLTPESLEGIDPLFAHFDKDFSSSVGSSRYAAVGVASEGSAIARGARAGRAIYNSNKIKLYDNTNGVHVANSTVTYAASGAFDAPTATYEMFVRGSGNGAVVTCQAKDGKWLNWQLTGDGKFRIRTSAMGSYEEYRLSASGVAEREWHHFALSYAPDADGDMTVRVYWDHMLVQDLAYSSAFDFTLPAELVLGSAAFAGDIDEVRMCCGAKGVDEMLYAIVGGLIILVK